MTDRTTLLEYLLSTWEARVEEAEAAAEPAFVHFVVVALVGGNQTHILTALKESLPGDLVCEVTKTFGDGLSNSFVVDANNVPGWCPAGLPYFRTDPTVGDVIEEPVKALVIRW